MKAEIVDVEIYTDSDHKSVLAELQIDHMIANKSKALTKKNRQGRTIYLYDQASEENWEDYATELQKQLKKSNWFERVSSSNNREDLPNIEFNLDKI